MFLLAAEYLERYVELRWNMVLELTKAERIEMLRHTRVPEILLLNWFMRNPEMCSSLLFIPDSSTPTVREKILEDARVLLPMRQREATLVDPLPTGPSFARVRYKDVKWIFAAITQNPKAGSFHWIHA
jgi:hypothetical protein